MLDSSESRTIPDFDFSLTLMIHTTHTQTRAIFRRFCGPTVLKGRPSVRGWGGYVRAPSIIAHRAAKLPDLCALADGTLREGKNPETSGEKAQKQHVGGQENREGPSGRWAGSPHTPRLPLAPALAAPHWSTSPRSSRAGIVTCVARVGGPPHCTVAI